MRLFLLLLFSSIFSFLDFLYSILIGRCMGHLLKHIVYVETHAGPVYLEGSYTNLSRYFHFMIWAICLIVQCPSEIRRPILGPAQMVQRVILW